MRLIDDASPFVIAEVSSNWHTFEDAKNSVQAAKQCGAHAVKFQFYRHAELYGTQEKPVTEGHEMPTDWLPKLKEKALACGIEFMCTAFSPDGVRTVDPFVNIHKVASAENNYTQLLMAIADTKKPVLVSTGGSTVLDLKHLVDRNGILKDNEVYLLYCNAAYPSRQHNLFNIDALLPLAQHRIGFSDHSTDVVYAPLSAYRHFNVKVIEKHFKLDHIEATPDAAHSLNTEEFAIMTRTLRGERDHVFLSPEEISFVTKHNRRLILRKNVAKGEALVYGDNYGVYRSMRNDTHGFNRVLPSNAKATRDLMAFESIGPGDVE